ncbi:MAG: hypothetical protein HOP19_02635 [Acidobacteria bacterium]|nr:hypothetical protein [Acidobacteriota bacterium]
MKPLFSDTSAEAERVLIECYRRMSHERKGRCIAEMNEALRALQLADIKARHPHADAYEIKMRLASRWIEPELMFAAFGWDIEKEGY